MDILRNLFSSLTSGIIRLLVTVGIIAAVGYFIVKPTLDTTNNAFRESLRPGASGRTDVNRMIEGVDREVRREVRRSIRFAKREGNPRRLVRCVKRARGDVAKIERCTLKF
jgi:hypothetical protein